ncbi:energy-coupling factor ABC transporter ATP-binding protein [Malikia spinosa]|uniref:energy-coupling factor ABC transporter ATP-binding protein n=1 Tax=Malikia spinosa TaxID=86180 RepID=UPI0027BA59C7|nr:ABC transporter ATP-binding protein [Malikia spinosa]
MTAVLELIEVGHVYPDGRAGLQHCSLRLRAAARHAVLGANGAGKTTLLQHLNALLRPQAGQVHFRGQPIDYRRQGLQRVRQEVGLVFQNPDRQLFSANVYEDVSFGPLNLGLDERQVRQLVVQALLAVGMAEHVDRPVQELSFGQKKRVCIAGVLAMQPRVLLLDEPMAGLDAEMQHELAVLLDGLIDQGVTVVLTSHDVDFAYRWADDIHLLAAGRCSASFPAADLLQHTEALRVAAQPLPLVLRLHAALTERGWIAEQTAPRSVEALLATLPPACTGIGHPFSSILSEPRFL